eukprot:CAMPEP_0196721966 /NCGR_PEP_ID=MMETSP1091-20130531/4410_1 /TAXON_ID=302021 /ORGANISM="Rhodomonas sp., Strain CCMP768" /LENGTH=237 /DNA_ID=CAMNT_0042063557 /DNA_START=119 /DNA_END=832 /DNA_ORIENTATION=+
MSEISSDFAKLGISGLPEMRESQLFGGALSIALPPAFVDVSEFRQLSDTQECWADAATDQSIVIEILAHDDEVADSACAEFYWGDILQCNDAEGSGDNMITVPTREISPEVAELLTDAPESTTNVAAPSCWSLIGVQQVAKFKDTDKNTVCVHVAVIRLPCVDSDIVVHFNQPLEISEGSSSALLANALPAGTVEQGNDLFFAMLTSLKVRDWGLFSSPDEDEEQEEDASSGVAAAG